MEKRIRAKISQKTGRVLSVKPIANSEQKYKNELVRPLDYDIIEKLAGKLFSGLEIAACIQMNRETWRRRLKVDETLRDTLERGKELGKGNLRKTMFDRAVKDGNTTMMIWLSKNYLGMSDKAEVEIADKKPTGVLLVPSQVSPSDWLKKNSEGEISEFDETPKSNLSL